MIKTLHLEQMTTANISDLVALSQSVQWDYSAGEVENFLTAGTVFGHKTQDGQFISSAGVFQYGSTLASLGIVIVHPEFQGCGLGKEVVRRCLEQAGQVPTMLISTVEGYRLYQSLGFQTAAFVHKLVSAAPVTVLQQAPRFDVRAILPIDQEDVIDLDERVMGADRKAFLRKRFQLMHSGAVLRDRNATLRGFGLAIRRHDLLIIGPLVAPDEDAASHMMNHLVSEWTGPVRIDVPARQKSLHSHLVEVGMVEAETPPIMLLNGTQLPGERQWLYAIAAQAFG